MFGSMLMVTGVAKLDHWLVHCFSCLTVYSSCAVRLHMYNSWAVKQEHSSLWHLSPDDRTTSVFLPYHCCSPWQFSDSYRNGVQLQHWHCRPWQSNAAADRGNPGKRFLPGVQCRPWEGQVYCCVHQLQQSLWGAHWHQHLSIYVSISPRGVHFLTDDTWWIWENVGGS